MGDNPTSWSRSVGSCAISERSGRVTPLSHPVGLCDSEVHRRVCAAADIIALPQERGGGFTRFALASHPAHQVADEDVELDVRAVDDPLVRRSQARLNVASAVALPQCR